MWRACVRLKSLYLFIFYHFHLFFFMFLSTLGFFFLFRLCIVSNSMITLWEFCVSICVYKAVRTRECVHIVLPLCIIYNFFPHLFCDDVKTYYVSYLMGFLLASYFVHHFNWFENQLIAPDIFSRGVISSTEFRCYCFVVVVFVDTHTSYWKSIHHRSINIERVHFLNNICLPTTYSN